MYASLYGGQAVEQALLIWKLMDEENRCLAGGSQVVHGLQNASVNPLGELVITMPEVAQAKHLYLRARLSSEQYELENCWDYWVFPQRKAADIEGVRIIHSGFLRHSRTDANDSRSLPRDHIRIP